MINLFNQIKFYLIILSTFYFVSCSNQPDVEIPEAISALENVTLIAPDATPLNNAEPVREAVFGDTDEVIIGQIFTFDIDIDGNVYLPDMDQQVIHVYSSDGTYIDGIGGEGSGPGEFGRISSISIDEKAIHVFDTQRMRISRFDVNSFQYIDDMELPFKPDFSSGYITFPQSLDVMSDGNYLIHFGIGFSAGQEDQEMERSVIGKKLDIGKGSFEPDTMYSFPASDALVHRDERSVHVMFPGYKRSAHVNYESGEIMHGWSEELLFKWYDENGFYTRSVYSPYEKVPLARNEVLKEYDDRDEPRRGMIRNDEFPETWPSFTHALSDDEGRVWVGLITNDHENYTWKSFSPEGEIYASFTWPRHIVIQRVKNGAIYTMETDPETDLRQVAKYRLP